jgi:hypothetical protein
MATGEWLAAELRSLRPDARCVVVPRGVDPHVFSGAAPGAAPGGPLRVVVDDRHADEPESSDERAVVAEAEAGLDVTALEPSDSAAERAAKLAGADVVLMLSPVDGALGGPLEGFVAGATCIVASSPDAADLVRHDVNGIVADPDDIRGTARWLDELAGDPERLARLRTGARETAASWPTADDAAERFAAALAQLVAEPPPPQNAWPTRLMGDAIGGATVFRQEIAALTAETDRLRGDQAYRTAVAVREKLRSPRLGPLRRIARPLLRRLRG